MCRADSDGFGSTRALRSRFDHAGEQEHFVVGRQAVDDRDDQHQDGRHDRPRCEVQQTGTVPVDEDPGQDSERRTQSERAHQCGLDGQDERAERQEHQQGRQQYDGYDHQRQTIEQCVDAVLLDGRSAADQHSCALGPVRGPQIVDGGTCLVPLRQTGLEDVDTVLGRNLGGELLDQTWRSICGLGNLTEGGVVGSLDDESNGLGAIAGEEFVELRLRDTRGAVRGQVRLVDTAELDARQRNDHQQ